MRLLLLALMLSGFGTALAGCSGNWGTASGTVTLDGSALKEGSITFHPEGEGPTAYGQVSNGEFTVSTGQQAGLPVGKYKVTVVHMTVPESGSKEKAKYLTPPRYARPETSGLEADVKPGGNSFQYELTSKQ